MLRRSMLRRSKHHRYPEYLRSPKYLRRCQESSRPWQKWRRPLHEASHRSRWRYRRSTARCLQLRERRPSPLRPYQHPSRRPTEPTRLPTENPEPSKVSASGASSSTPRNRSRDKAHPSQRLAAAFWLRRELHAGAPPNRSNKIQEPSRITSCRSRAGDFATPRARTIPSRSFVDRSTPLPA